MDIEVFRRRSAIQYESYDILDAFTSLIVNERFIKENDFAIKLPLAKRFVSLLVPDTVLFIDGCYYYIDDAHCDDANSKIWDVSGRSLYGKAETRIINRIYNKTRRPELICYDHLNNELVAPSDTRRRVDYLKVIQPGALTATNIQYQNSYGNVYEEITTLCDTYGFGFREIPISISQVGSTIEFYAGRDLSDIVEFKSEYDNLLNERYENNNYDEMTTAVVFGEGEGSARKSVVVNGSLSGLDRKELMVDARDLQQTVDDVKMSDSEYLALLNDRGTSKLTEYQKILLLSGDINVNDSLFVYGDDYQLGDRLRISSELFQLTKTGVLMEMEKSWDEKGFTMTPTFDKESPTIKDLINRK